MELQNSLSQTNVKSRSQQQGNAIVLVLLILIVAAGAGAGGYWLWQQQMQLSSQLEQQVSAAKKDLANEQAGLRASLDKPIKEFEAAVKLQRQSQLALAKQIEEQQNKLAQLTSTDRTDWLLAETEFLLRLAHQRLTFSGEVNNAMALLKAADDILLKINELHLAPIRQAIADELLALQATPEVDVIGIHSRLSSVRKKIGELKLYDAEYQVTAAAKTEAEQSSGLEKALATISQYFRIERRSADVKALPDNRELAILEKNIQLLLNQAQAALLSTKVDVYQASLRSASEQIEANYDRADKLTQALLASLGELEQVNINPNTPDITTSQSLLQAYLNRSHYRPAVEIKEPKPAETSQTLDVPPKPKTVVAGQEAK